jgi:hypothetical protein
MSRRANLYRSPLRYPVYIYAYQLAQIVGWEPRRVQRLWEKHGICMQLENGYYVTTPDKLQMLWPEQWEAILDRLEEGLLEPPKEKRRKYHR